MKSRPTIIVLAAGRGTRFHGTQHKLSQALGASCVLASTLQHALASNLAVMVVTIPSLARLVHEHVATRDVLVLSEPNAPFGMGHSIAAGVLARSNASGWLVLPADMPLIKPATLRAVAAELEHHPVAFAQHRGLRGHPVGFAAELYSDLVRLTGDQGAQRLVARYPSKEVEVDDPGVLLDIDTEADLQHLRLQHAAGTPAAGRTGQSLSEA